MGGSESKNEEKRVIDDEELLEIFKHFDKDNSGAITAEELHTVLKAFGKHVTHAEIVEMIKHIDLNKDGMIDFHEFKKIMNDQGVTGDSEQDIKAGFKILSEDHKDKILTKESLKKTMKELGTELTDKEIEAVFKHIDYDKNGSCTFDEFVSIWNAKLE
eukprot:CAMPEP_0176446766 /NCGR_PEP_ID=MMETSP0127-20121128/24535_1 /TAXON_ID=938130 /ORGANISM="Platyophrya macrostoma, Strain WH" /LENGTH=158 /DNA_ID=CAMNT_0017832891 /DNA_START=18 /DNA_END=494 /DNA_ORIENTATION=-